MDTIFTIVKVLAIWTLISIPVSLFAAKFIAVGNKAPRSK